MLDIDCLFMWRATLAFRVCEEAVEHRFYGLVFHIWRRESNQESVGDAQNAITILFSQLALKGGGAKGTYSLISMKLIIS
jgi:hypothetical protein